MWGVSCIQQHIDNSEGYQTVVVSLFLYYSRRPRIHKNIETNQTICKRASYRSKSNFLIFSSFSFHALFAYSCLLQLSSGDYMLTWEENKIARHTTFKWVHTYVYYEHSISMYFRENNSHVCLYVSTN